METIKFMENGVNMMNKKYNIVTILYFKKPESEKLLSE